MSEEPKVIHCRAESWAIGEQRAKRPPRRPPLKGALEAAKAAGLTIKGAVIENGKVKLEFVGEPTAAASSNAWDKAIEKAVSRREIERDDA